MLVIMRSNQCEQTVLMVSPPDGSTHVFATLTIDNVTKVKESELQPDQQEPAVRLKQLIHNKRVDIPACWMSKRGWQTPYDLKPE